MQNKPAKPAGRPAAPRKAAAPKKSAAPRLGAAPRQGAAPQPPRQMAPWLLLVIDVVLIGVCLVIFALFDHVLPEKRVAVPVATAQPTPIATPQPAEVGDDTAGDALPEPTEAPAPQAGDFSQKFADKFTDGEVVQTEDSYQSANLNITLTRYDFNVGDYEQAVYV